MTAKSNANTKMQQQLRDLKKDVADQKSKVADLKVELGEQKEAIAVQVENTQIVEDKCLDKFDKLRQRHYDLRDTV